MKIILKPAHLKESKILKSPAKRGAKGRRRRRRPKGGFRNALGGGWNYTSEFMQKRGSWPAKIQSLVVGFRIAKKID